MEFMDAGSLEKLAGYEVPEDVLARVTACTVRGLRFLKDELQTMHRGRASALLDHEPILRHDLICRCQTYKYLDQSSWFCQIMRFWCVRSARAKFGQDEYRLPIIYGCKYFMHFGLPH